MHDKDLLNLLSTLQDYANLGYWQYDVASGEIEWSDQVYKIYGLEQGSKPSFEQVADAFAAEDRIQYFKDFELAIKQGVPYWFERQIKLENGTSKYIRGVGQPKLESGRVVALVGIVQDVTQEHLRISHLTESRQLLEAASQIAKIGYWRLDLADNELIWSDETFRIHGLDPGEIRPTLEHAVGLYHPDDIAIVQSHIESSIGSGDDWEFKARIYRVDGELRYVRSKGKVLVVNGKKVALFGIFQDISEQLKLAEQQKWWQYLVNETGEGIVITDAVGKTVWVNQAFEQQTGYLKHEVQGVKPGLLLQGPETCLDTVKRISQALQAGEAIAVELLNYTKLAEPYWILLSIFPRFDDHGNLVQFMSIQVDITERVEMETQLSKKQSELELLNFQLSRQKLAAEESLRREAETNERLEQEVQKSKALQEQLRALANVDSLTGIANRRHFLERFAVEFERAKRYLHDLSLCMFDIDHFKQVNDSYGHQAGDELLKAVAAVTAAELRGKLDVFGRIGGEEFAIVLPETSLDGASKLIERIRVNIEREKVSDGNAVTCSFGLLNALEFDNVEDALYQCDQTMYQAKRLGRNRVELYDSKSKLDGRNKPVDDGNLMAS